MADETLNPNEDDPTRFWRLDGDGNRLDFQCGRGTYFHPELQACVHPYQMPSGYTAPEGWAPPEGWPPLREA
ncbi:chitin binding peritrophin-A domain-containing protein [Streptomyces sp. NPDC058646]|uniref:chitin binding peritrophin-A domain-containing protein n=1 Tax=Streptomyces sp. NPDC058646 TaxID=3346574 RepID=UPI003669E6A3